MPALLLFKGEMPLPHGDKWPHEGYLLISAFPLSTVFSSSLGLGSDFCVLFMGYYGCVPFLKQLCLPLLPVYKKQQLYTDDLLERKAVYSKSS